MNVTDQLVEVMARAIYDAARKSSVTPDSVRETDWETLTRWAAQNAAEVGHITAPQAIRGLAFAEARAALTALRKAEEENGWRCVHVLPTMKMREAFYAARDEFCAGLIRENGADAALKALLLAAPLPPGSTG